MEKSKKLLVRGVVVEIMSRTSVFDAIVETRKTPLAGMVVLEKLDLWPDVQNGKLVTNPLSPKKPLYNLL